MGLGSSLDAARTIPFVLASQIRRTSTLAIPGQLLPLRTYVACLAGFGMIFLLRLQNPSLGTVPRHALTHAPATREALVTEIRLFERMSRRGYRIAIAPGMLFIIAGATIEAAKKGRPLWPALIMIALMAGMGIVIHMSSQGWARKLGVRIDTLGSIQP